MLNKRIICLIAGLLLANTAAAEPVLYVSDELAITMRSGQSTKHQITRMLKSGTRLEILQNNKESGYSLARLADGTQGWVLNQYLSATPAARQRLAEAEAKITQLEQALSSSADRLQQASSAQQERDQRSTQLSEENSRLKMELQEIREISRDVITLHNDNKTLREKVIRLETDLQMLDQQNMVLQDRSERNWFIAGTGVALLGIMIGLIAPGLRFKRKPKWSEL